MKLISVNDVVRDFIREVGCDPESLGIDSVEVLSSLVRRAAGLLCPCTKKMLLKNITLSLDGVASKPEAIRDAVDETVELLVAHGDLLEHSDSTVDSPRRSEVVISRAPLSFVKRQSGACVILGVAPDDRPFLPDAIQEKIQYNNFNRVIPADAAPNLAEQLTDIGLIELPYEAWSKFPNVLSPDRHIDEIDRNLASSLAHDTDNIDGLRILDPSTPVEFYPARWVIPKEKTGQFIGRRPQAYGADLWCYVHLVQGRPKRFIDLPLLGSRWRGCDEAWHLQAAIDAISGNPQQYGVREGAQDYKIVALYSPIPSWIQRRWVMVGVSIPRERCLLSFRFHSTEIDEEIKFAKEHLWLTERTRKG